MRRKPIPRILAECRCRYPSSQRVLRLGCPPLQSPHRWWGVVQSTGSKGETMSRGIWRQGAAGAAVALVAALAGTVYAAGKINGHAIKVKSLPGNRLALHSVPANRLKPGTIPNLDLAPGSIQGDRLAPGSVTGLQVDVSTLGQVPSAVHADTAESAKDAQTALNAANAVNAQAVNGYQA